VVAFFILEIFNSLSILHGHVTRSIHRPIQISYQAPNFLQPIHCENIFKDVFVYQPAFGDVLKFER